MTTYNGFPPDFRTDVYNIQKAMGLMVPISKCPCSMCAGQGGMMMGHTENYYDLWDLRPMCVECHMKLHGRFSRPGNWIAHLIEIIEGRSIRQWLNTQEFFAAQKRRDAYGFSPEMEWNKDLAGENPALMGSGWFYQLRMVKIDLFSRGDRQLPRRGKPILFIPNAFNP